MKPLQANPTSGNSIWSTLIPRSGLGAAAALALLFGGSLMAEQARANNVDGAWSPVTPWPLILIADPGER